MTRWRIPFQIFLALCLLLGIQYIAFRHYGHFDFSRSHRFSLSNQGSVLFSGIKQPARFIIYCSPTSLEQSAELYSDLQALMQEYQIKARENLIVEYLDPTRNLNRARELQSKYQFNPNENVLIIDYLHHSSVIPIKTLGEYNPTSSLIIFKGEQVINAALIELSGVPLKKIYFLQGHGEMLPGTAPLELIGRYLEHQHLLQEPLNLASTLKVPEDASLVVIAGARFDLSEQESEALKTYWQSAGRLFVLLDPGAITPLLTKVLQEGGITPNSNRIVRQTSLNNPSSLLYDVTGEFVPGSELTKQFLPLNILFLGTTQSLDLASTSGDLQLRPLIQAIKGFEAIPYPPKNDQPPSLAEENISATPLVIAAMADRGALHDDRVAVNASRMVAVGNSDFMKDKNINTVGLDFFSSSLNELIDRVQLTGNTAKMKAYYTLNISAKKMTSIALWCILFIPLLAGLFSLILLWKHRR